MTRKTSAVSVVLGVGALLAGAFMGLRPLPSPQSDQETCGSAFAPSIGDYSDALSRAFFKAVCADAVNQAKVVSIVLVLLAAALVVAGAIGLAGARPQHHASILAAKRPEPHAPVAEQLERLAALHANGTITNAEFEAAKRKVLNETNDQP
ncbi:SHOCT domain-containing protein [Cellulomonas sp. CW35]|uniref:SHOCT domain-containing protein n=1 Tax=Cellulomonas sp. CW35 TaxID=3458249 RepID=UPI00403415BC